MTVDSHAVDAATEGVDIALGADAELDRINLAQALKDFEIANRRVLDLTHRLATANRELMQARSELGQLQARYGAIARYVEVLSRSSLFPILKAIARRTRLVKQ